MIEYYDRYLLHCVLDGTALANHQQVRLQQDSKSPPELESSVNLVDANELSKVSIITYQFGVVILFLTLNIK